MSYAVNYPTSYESACAELDGTSRIPRCAHNTELIDGRDPLREWGTMTQWVAVKYHNTHVVTFYCDGMVKLDTGGWHSSTTKQRLNACSDFYLPTGERNPNCFQVWQVDSEWFLSWRGEVYPFDGNELTMRPSGLVTCGVYAGPIAPITADYRTENNRRIVVRASEGGSMNAPLHAKEIDTQTDGGWERGWLTEWRTIPSDPEREIRASLTVHMIGSNRAPYFSLTGEIRDNRTHRWDGGGACHEPIVEAFPMLEEFAALHLCAADGTPMHHVENAVYFAEHVMGISRWDPIDDARGVFERHVLAGTRDDDVARMAGVFAPIDCEPDDGIVFEQWATSPASLGVRRQILRERVEAFCAPRDEALAHRAAEALRTYRITLPS